jgi:hypothetical protein
MPADDKMTIDERRKYLRQMQKRYREADRSVREQLVDETGHVIQLHRKSPIRLMGSDLERQPRREQRGRTYGPGVVGAVWKAELCPPPGLQNCIMACSSSHPTTLFSEETLVQKGGRRAFSSDDVWTFQLGITRFKPSLSHSPERRAGRVTLSFDLTRRTRAAFGEL